ncbi:MAG: alkaline phosphatase family protein [Chloroflexi bacterium]|nr:MAG: alkaline phosphatase family protein [Chloroflexota bacterium]
MGRGLIVIHVDGLSHANLQRAVAAGQMPFVGRLLADAGYEALPYRCGVPSTTPFAQAGILYGDNDEIPSYRWWDKERDLLVAFGSGATFHKVAGKYFQGREPLTRGGCCIAALYAAGDQDRFGPAYEERHTDANRKVILPFLTDPVTLYYWIRHGGRSVAMITGAYVKARLRGRRAAGNYVIADLYHEVVVHHLTRFALLQAIGEGLPVIYACYYTFDEAAHAFGPEHPESLRILRHVDHTIRLAVRRARDRYEVVVLSDHGQVETEPFLRKDGRRLGEILAGWLPGQQVQEFKGGRFGPENPSAGRVVITYSGGLGHVYFRDLPGRLQAPDIDSRYPGLVQRLAALERIGFVLLRDGDQDVYVTGEGRLADPRQLLAGLDDPEVIGAQLHRLNSFQRSGDLVVFGRYRDGRQVNFENQVGGHGSAGGEQLHPFLLARRECGLDTSAVASAEELHPLLTSLRDRLAAAS